jgi:hypothetical protein
MTLVTVEVGPLWKMQLLRDVLEERGVQAFVADSNLKTIDPFITGAMAFDARLQVQEETVESAREALAGAREDAKAIESSALADLAQEAGDAEEMAAERPEPPPALETMTDLGRRIRWAAVLFWMHPFVFVYGVRYLRGARLLAAPPRGHALTLVALVVVTTLWVVALSAVLVLGP